MAMGGLHSVSALVAAWGRRVSRKLLGGGDRRSIDHAKIAPSWAPYLSRRMSLLPFRGVGKKAAEEDRRRRRRRRGDFDEETESSGEEEERGKEDGGVWQRTILMGERCQPLDFSGVIHYDSQGKQLSDIPPRSPLRSPLPSFSIPPPLSPRRAYN
ncbi:unnamed protein product [Spirodela intermedia]|uniref:Uncharacterized protein n=1 Tax=Spirodela intermedia TaxID=51605 RepID=A0A7I8LEQ9_SPIIN|nr:unnamed protein product [Spirodela intermedia]